MSFKRQERLRDTVTKSYIHLQSTKKLPIKLSDKLFVPKSWHCLPTFNTEATKSVLERLLSEEEKLIFQDTHTTTENVFSYITEVARVIRT